MVLVEDRGGAVDVDVLGGWLTPGQVEQPVHPGAHHAHLRGGAGDLLEPRHLLERARLHVGGHAECLDARHQVLALVALAVELGELLAHRAELLPEDVLTL